MRVLSVPNPAAGRHQHTPPLETPGNSQASLGQSLVGSLLLSPGPGAHKGLFVPSKFVFPVCVSSGGSTVGLMVNSSKRAYAIPKSAANQSPCPCGSPLLTCTSSGDTQTQFCLSRCGPLGPGAHKVCLSPLSISGGYGS